MEKVSKLYIGIVMILMASVFSCTGQLLWKLAVGNNALVWVIGGMILYFLGALLMMGSFRFGELSILHPMMSFGYVLSIFLGATVLHENVTPNKVIGVVFIIIGMVFLCRSGKKEVNV